MLRNAGKVVLGVRGNDMYFFLEKGKQILDLKGNLILSHNDELVKSRVSSASPKAIRNPLYILNIKSMNFFRKLQTTYVVIHFVWGRNQALKPEQTPLNKPVRKT